MADTPSRDQIKQGTKVGIETKKDQGTGKISIGIVKNILTSSNVHPHGIKVELEDGQVGRVKELFVNTGNVIITESEETRDGITTKRHEIVGPGDEDFETGVEITLDEEPHKSSNMDTSIPKHEDEFNEFKSTFQYDLTEEDQRRNGKTEAADARKNNYKVIRDDIQKEISLTVAAFANHDGGRLFVGVNDEGLVLGLDRDLKESGNSPDKLQLAIRDSLKKFLKNNAFISKLKFVFADNNGKQYLVIRIPASNEPIFVNTSSGQETYLRMQNSSEKLSAEDFLKHYKDRFHN